MAGMSGLLADLVDQTPAVVGTVRRQIPKNFPMELADAVLDGLVRQVGVLADGLTVR